MKKVFLLLLCFCVYSSGQDNGPKKIYETTQKVIAGDSEALKSLYAMSIKGVNKELHPLLTQTVTLIMLKSSSNKVSSYINNMSKKYPKSNLFAFLQLPPLRAECSGCKGNGQKLINCRKCQKGDCRNCKGNGHISYGTGKSKVERKCVACKTTGACVTCQGSSQVAGDCRICKKSGIVFNKQAIAKETDRIIKVLLNKSAELSGQSSVNQEILRENETLISKGKKWVDEAKSKRLMWTENEKKRLTAALKARKKKQNAGNGQLITMVDTEVVEEYEEGGSTQTLDKICEEVNNYLAAQEKKSGQKILSKVYGQFLSDIPTIHIVVSNSFASSGYDYKYRAADGFYRFAIMRAQRNGYDDADVKLLNQGGEQIGGVKDGKFWVKK